MKLVILKDISYDKYNAIRNALFKHIPFSIINAEYCNDKGYFYFWDVSYIPDKLLEPEEIQGNKAKVNECNRILITIFGKIE